MLQSQRPTSGTLAHAQEKARPATDDACMELRSEQQAQFERDGYLVIPNVKPAGEIAELRSRADEIVGAFDERESKSIFTTADERTKNDDYFLSSGSTVRCFFEEEAFDSSGRLRQSKALSINKIGHAMHDLDPVFMRFSHGPALQTIARTIGLAAPLVYQSMYIFKQPNIGGEVRWHQDATYFLTDPLSVVTFWFALEAADTTNGCLWVEPGGHRTPLREIFRVDDGRASVRSIDSTPWPDSASAIPVEVEPGTLVLLHGLLPHYSAPNRSARSRHAYTLHAVDARTAYASSNWLQRPDEFAAHDFM